MNDSEPSFEKAPRSLFPTTSWTVVKSLSGQEPSFSILAWDDFCGAYWRPLHAWLRLRGVSHETAEDLVQGFLAKLHASPVAIGQLHPDKGRLRSYLLAALKNFWTDHIRSRKLDQRPAESDLLPLADELPNDQDILLFDREWAVAILARSVAILRGEYVARGNAVLFDSLLPLIENDDATARDRAADLCGLSGNTFNVAIKRLRERLAARLRAEVASTLFGADEPEIDDELRHLIVVLGRQGFGDALSPPPVLSIATSSPVATNTRSPSPCGKL